MNHGATIPQVADASGAEADGAAHWVVSRPCERCTRPCAHGLAGPAGDGWRLRPRCEAESTVDTLESLTAPAVRMLVGSVPVAPLPEVAAPGQRDDSEPSRGGRRGHGAQARRAHLDEPGAVAAGCRPGRAGGPVPAACVVQHGVPGRGAVPAGRAPGMGPVAARSPDPRLPFLLLRRAGHLPAPRRARGQHRGPGRGAHPVAVLHARASRACCGPRPPGCTDSGPRSWPRRCSPPSPARSSWAPSRPMTRWPCSCWPWRRGWASGRLTVSSGPGRPCSSRPASPWPRRTP